MKAHLSAVSMFLISKYGTVKNLNQLTFKSTQEQMHHYLFVQMLYAYGEERN